VNVSCPECRSVFRVDPGKIPSGGIRARCSVCGGVITVGGGESVDEEFAPTRTQSPAPVQAMAADIGPGFQGSSGSGDDKAAEGAADIGPGFQGSSGSGDDKAAEGAADIGPGFQGSSGSGDDKAPQGATSIGVQDAVTEPMAIVDRPASSGVTSSEPVNPMSQPSPSATTMVPPSSRPPAPASPAAATGTTAPVPLRPTIMPPIGPGRPAPFGGAARPPVPSNPSAPRPAAIPLQPPVRPSAFPPRPTVPMTPPVLRPSMSAQPTPPASSAMPPQVPPHMPRHTAPLVRPSMGSQPTPPAAATPAPTPASATPRSATPAGVRPPSGTPTRVPINPFLANDPNAKARRLARALVSDLVTYFPQKREEGIRNGNMKELFREEIKKSYEEFVDQVGREFADSTSHFQDALNDILGAGQKIF
jgi:predicted Zn finger-like uncharacterized protein